MDFIKLINEYKNCPCGKKHECEIKDIRIGSGIACEVGEILVENGFPKRLLVVADKTTAEVGKEIFPSLSEFDVTEKLYDELRVATMDEVEVIEGYIDGGIEAVLSIGTGSLHDICRLACARKDKPLCLFGTAPSMDGFASYSAPIVNGNFKITYPAKSPEVIIADTRILACSPAALKSAGFGDMVAKYVALIDWKVSNIISGEPCCERIYNLTRDAVDRVFAMADRVTQNDEETARAILEGLIMTGIAMGFEKTSRPGSGTEHIMAHYIECKQLLEGIVPNFHGEDVGVCTLIMLKYYRRLLSVDSVTCRREQPDWDKIYAAYGELSEDVRALNTPDTITDGIDPELLESKFGEIKGIIGSVPSYEEVLDKMRRAGCKITYGDIGKPLSLMEECFEVHPFMRRRLSLKRLTHMMELPKWVAEDII